MIRRDLPLASGEPGWALVSQIEHARLSGQLARQVASLPGTAEDRRQVVAAIDRHDDGWAASDAQPPLDEHGRPRSFMEMQLDDSLAIWTASVDQAEQIGPLAGWLVASHFAQLLGGPDRHPESAAARWREQMASRRAGWLTAWGGEKQAAEAALVWLQTLDAASLWICGQCPAAGDPAVPSSDPYQTAIPTGAELAWHAAGPGALTVSSGAFRPGRLLLELTGSVAPATRYEKSADLLAAATPRLFRWDLVCLAGS